MKRLLLVLFAVVALAGTSARGDSLCARADVRYPSPLGGRPLMIQAGPYCAPAP